jgi:hypothetical protein
MFLTLMVGLPPAASTNNLFIINSVKGSFSRAWECFQETAFLELFAVSPD